jgi:hypothetical protein
MDDEEEEEDTEENIYINFGTLHFTRILFLHFKRSKSEIIKNAS